MSPSGVGKAEPPPRPPPGCPLARVTVPPLRRMPCPHKDGVVDMRFLTLIANFRRPAGSGLGGLPLEVRDLS